MTPTPQTIAAVAVTAQCSPATVARYLAGKSGKPSIRARIEKALRAHDLGRLTRGQGRPAALRPVP